MTARMPAALVSRARAAAAEALVYLHRRQSPSGGFCFYRTQYVEEPSLGDTYHAVAALRLLGAEVPRQPQLLQYLNDAQQFGLSYLYFYAFTLDLLGDGASIRPDHLASICRLVISAPDSSRAASTSEWLEKTLRTICLQRRFCPVPAYPHLLRWVNGLRRDGGFGDKPNLLDTCLGLTILSLIGDSNDKADIASFVDAHQRLPSGFTLTTDSSMATVEIVLAGLQCCALLGLPVRYETQALDFTLGCAANNGGFARAPVALPDLECTHQALQVIASVTPEALSLA